ncbi:hypothetical protein L1987_23280 [Smallanthus sonchifolius]|uniref:Uncharacterized protein n=1 Tax=Smallanthus sonchifolius TaxID=185202 RepID=A0ACB9IGH0_9ASTR|nr:hypothetical protein L1987_23280 [Smallanthus sonchifolius]
MAVYFQISSNEILCWRLWFSVVFVHQSSLPTNIFHSSISLAGIMSIDRIVSSLPILHRQGHPFKLNRGSIRRRYTEEIRAFEVSSLSVLVKRGKTTL